ncbi:hypothetical protein GDO81_022471 [Engystomops pustulosus]|uniref:Uncharacterized protein n=1 Tax=Engystomops pustulosus TaxID=76066 RepID=A0AAV6Z679_ENGPU|nr:hypothetical protein GDO81_022471 [Engystomops pustulosus]
MESDSNSIYNETSFFVSVAAVSCGSLKASSQVGVSLRVSLYCLELGSSVKVAPYLTGSLYWMQSISPGRKPSAHLTLGCRVSPRGV